MRAERNKVYDLALLAILGLTLSLGGLAVFGQQPVPSRSTKSETNAQTGDAVSEKPNAKAFATPHAAAAALCWAARTNDSKELAVVLGPNSTDLLNWSEGGADDQERQEFVMRYEQMHRLVKEPDDTVTLYVGAENWPLPIPIVEYQGKWYFDTDLGKQEILYRQLGRNEMEALNVCHALVDAEKEYYAANQVYTDVFVSTDHNRNGLYWPSENVPDQSPIGRYLAQAGVNGTTNENHVPFHGYFYRILLQNPVAPNGDAKAANAGFVVEAFPAKYRVSGVMTFFMDPNGDAYEKDLGTGTDNTAIHLTEFHRDNSWNKVD